MHYTWNESSDAIEAMHIGLKAKFDQNSYMRKVLLSTGEDILVEANPNDTSWGAGLNHSVLTHMQNLPKVEII